MMLLIIPVSRLADGPMTNEVRSYPPLRWEEIREIPETNPAGPGVSGLSLDSHQSDPLQAVEADSATTSTSSTFLMCALGVHRSRNGGLTYKPRRTCRRLRGTGCPISLKEGDLGSPNQSEGTMRGLARLKSVRPLGRQRTEYNMVLSWSLRLWLTTTDRRPPTLDEGVVAVDIYPTGQ